MNEDGEEEAPRPRPLSGGLRTLFSWLRRDERSHSSDSLSSAGSDRTVASFAFLCPDHYCTAAVPLVVPPPGPPTDSYKKRVHDRNIRRQYDRDITLHRKYGLYRTEGGCSYDAFSLPPTRRVNVDLNSRSDRDRRATSECLQRRALHVPGKRRAPLPPAHVSLSGSSTLNKRHSRKRRAPEPPVNSIVKLNQVQDNLSLMNSDTTLNKQPLQSNDNAIDLKSSKYGKPEHSSKDIVKPRQEKSFLKQIFENRKRNSTIETSSVKLLPSISELDKQAAEIIETNKQRLMNHNGFKPEREISAKTSKDDWICTKCLRKYNASVLYCLYCPRPVVSPKDKNLNNSTLTNGIFDVSNRNSKIEDKQKLKEMLKEMKDSLPKRPKHETNLQNPYKNKTDVNKISEIPTLPIGCSFTRHNDLPSQPSSSNNITKPKAAITRNLTSGTTTDTKSRTTENIIITQIIAPHSNKQSKSENQCRPIINNHAKKLENSDAAEECMKNTFGATEKNSNNNLGMPLKISSLLNPVYVPKVAKEILTRTAPVEKNEIVLTNLKKNNNLNISAVLNDTFTSTVSSGTNNQTNLHKNPSTSKDDKKVIALPKISEDHKDKALPKLVENPSYHLPKNTENPNIIDLPKNTKNPNNNALSKNTENLNNALPKVTDSSRALLKITEYSKDKDPQKRIKNSNANDLQKNTENSNNNALQKHKESPINNALLKNTENSNNAQPKITNNPSNNVLPKTTDNLRDKARPKMIEKPTNELQKITETPRDNINMASPTITNNSSEKQQSSFCENMSIKLINNQPCPSPLKEKTFDHLNNENSKIACKTKVPINTNSDKVIVSKHINNTNIENKNHTNSDMPTSSKNTLMPNTTDVDKINQHSRRRDLINQLEQSIAKGDERAAADAAVKLAQLKLSCSVLSFSSQIIRETSRPGTSQTIVNIGENNSYEENIQITQTNNNIAQSVTSSSNEQKSPKLTDNKSECALKEAKALVKENLCAASSSKSGIGNKDNMLPIAVWVEDKEATRGPVFLQIKRNAIMRELRLEAETSLGLPIHMQRWIVGRILCNNDNTPLYTVAGPELTAPFYLCLVETETSEEQAINGNQQNTPSEGTSNVYNELVKLEQQAYIPNPEEFECEVCMEICAPEAGIVLRECVHSFCRECISDVVRHSEEPIVACPSIACRGIIQEREIRALVPSDEYERWLARGLAAAESRTRNAFHCRTRDCTGWALCEPGAQRFPCPVCLHTNCVTCQAIHEKETCEQHQAKLQQASKTAGAGQIDDETRELLKSLVSRGEALECPECTAIIMKKWGCDWVKCSACKTEICWATRGYRWGPGGRGDISGGCRCGIDGKKCHPSCSYCH